jgi:hypothetical protein
MLLAQGACGTTEADGDDSYTSPDSFSEEIEREFSEIDVVPGDGDAESVSRSVSDRTRRNAIVFVRRVYPQLSEATEGFLRSLVHEREERGLSWRELFAQRDSLGSTSDSELVTESARELVYYMEHAGIVLATSRAESALQEGGEIGEHQLGVETVTCGILIGLGACAIWEIGKAIFTDDCDETQEAREMFCNMLRADCVTSGGTVTASGEKNEGCEFGCAVCCDTDGDGTARNPGGGWCLNHEGNDPFVEAAERMQGQPMTPRPMGE